MFASTVLDEADDVDKVDTVDVNDVKLLLRLVRSEAAAFLSKSVLNEDMYCDCTTPKAAAPPPRAREINC